MSDFINSVWPLLGAKDIIMDASHTGYGEESKEVDVQFNNAYLHYCSPFSRQDISLVLKFNILAETWKNDIQFLSSISEIVLHPAYQEIIGMGEKVIPLILKDLDLETNHWFWALKAISGEDPVRGNVRGDVEEMKKTWLEWGRAKGFIF